MTELNRRVECAKRGQKKYMSHKECKKCGTSERYVMTGHCVKCAQTYARKKYYETRELMKRSFAESQKV